MYFVIIFGQQDLFGHQDIFGHQNIVSKSERRRKTTYSSVRPRELKLITWSIKLEIYSEKFRENSLQKNLPNKYIHNKVHACVQFRNACILIKFP